MPRSCVLTARLCMQQVNLSGDWLLEGWIVTNGAENCLLAESMVTGRCVVNGTMRPCSLCFCLLTLEPSFSSVAIAFTL